MKKGDIVRSKTRQGKPLIGHGGLYRLMEAPRSGGVVHALPYNCDNGLTGTGQWTLYWSSYYVVSPMELLALSGV